jgi:NAD(P)-dependent dehydrogenase (short-subunit alcohol dehydrogenase family)
MDLGLTNAVVVVTGASKGIGLAITRGFVAEGAHVIAGARTTSAELSQLALDGSVDVVEVDLADPQGPARLISAAGDRIDVLVNNVGQARTRLDGFVAITDQMWQETLNLDLMAGIRAIRGAVPVMLGAGGGVIVNIVSLNARLPDPAVLDYSAAKAAFENASKSLSKELGPKGIRVNTVDPGPVATDLWLGQDGVASTVGRASDRDPQEIAAAAAAGMATGRFSRPDEVADLVLMLASSRTANITGASFVIDGGMVATI